MSETPVASHSLLVGISRLIENLGLEKIIRFCFIGIMSTLVDIGLLYFFVSYLQIWYIYSAAISYCCGVFFSYNFNKYFTFHDKNEHILTQFTTFAGISLGSLFLNIAIIWVLVEIFSQNYLIAKIFSTVGMFLMNYYCQSRVTFRKKLTRNS